MVKHTQTIRRQQPPNCLSVFDHFVGLALKGLNFPIQETSRGSYKSLIYILFTYPAIYLGEEKS